jgi:WD repeat-containing protein 61
MSKTQINKLFDIQGHKDCIYSLAPGADKAHFFTGGGEGWAVSWDLSNKEKPGKLIARLPGSIFALHYLKAQNTLLAGHRAGGLHKLDLNQKKELAHIDVKGSVFDIKSVEEKNRLLVASSDGYISFYELDTFKLIKKLKAGDDNTRCLTLHPDREFMAAGFSDNHIRIINLDSMEVTEKLQSQENSVFCLEFLENKKLLSGGRDAKFRIYEPEDSYKLFLEIPAHMFTINHIAISPDNKYAATASRDKSIRVWDTESWELLKVLDFKKTAGHSHSVNKLLWTAYENILISCGDDKKVIAWQMT